MVALGALLLLPVIGQAIKFYNAYGVSPATGALSRQNLGNLLAPLSPYEALGLWPSSDFRHVPLNSFHAGQLAILAVAVVAFGAWSSLRRRELLLPAAAGACLLIWWYSERSQSPYVAAKALAIGAPVFVALGLRSLLSRDHRTTRRNVLALAAAAVFCGFAGYSTLLMLRNEPLQAPEAQHELAGFHRITGNQPVLFLGVDDFAPWQLREAAVSTLSPPTFTQGLAGVRRNKPYVSGQPLDFDSVDPASLDNFRYVITASGAYTSQPPGNFRQVRAAALYDLWERTGPTTARQIIEQPGAAGGVLNCRANRLGAATGVASVMATPHVLPGFVVLPDHSGTVEFALPPGRWALSIQYFSDLNFEVAAASQRWKMPAYVGRNGPWFALGTVETPAAGPLLVTVKVPGPTVLTGYGLVTTVTGLAATRVPDTHTLVSLRRACGRYVDWYRLTSRS